MDEAINLSPSAACKHTNLKLLCRCKTTIKYERLAYLSDISNIFESMAHPQEGKRWIHFWVVRVQNRVPTMCCGAQEKTDVHCHVKWRGQGSRTLFLRASVPLFLSTCLAPRPEGRDKETAVVSHHVGQTFLKFCRHQVDSVSLSSFSSGLSFVCMNQWERCLCTPFPLGLGVWSEMMNQLRELQPHSGKIRKIASSRKF